MRLLRFKDLRERVIVRNRATLKRWQDELGFPTGFMIGENSRVFGEDDVNAWLVERAAKTGETKPPGTKRPKTAAASVAP